MADRAPASDARVLAAMMAAFILYGSLYPFQVRALPEGMALAAALLAAWQAPVGGRGDMVANAVLYAPLGFAMVRAVRWHAAVAVGLAVLACGVLAAGVETAQLFVPGRTASGYDLVLNLAGGAVGAVAAAVLGRGRPGRMRVADGAAAVLVGCWLGYRLYPLVPAIDLGEWTASLRPLAGDWWAEPGRALRLGGAWLVAARMLAAAVPAVPAWVVMAGAVAAAVPVVARVVTPAEVLAVLGALLAWAVLRGRRHRDKVLLAVMLAVVLAEGLAPYRLAEARAFGWLPFGPLLRGQYAAGVQAVLLKAFLYGGLLWLGAQCALRPGRMAAAVVALALAVSLAQTRLPGRSADITDATLALCLAVALRPGLRARDRGGCGATDGDRG